MQRTRRARLTRRRARGGPERAPTDPSAPGVHSPASQDLPPSGAAKPGPRCCPTGPESRTGSGGPPSEL